MSRREHSDDGTRRQARFHGRIDSNGARCAVPGCNEPGEFRAPLDEPIDQDRPRPFRLLCLNHVRAFNSRYNFFDGMSVDEIHHAQRPMAGWERETRAFARAGRGDQPPRWADFSDPLDAINARFRQNGAQGSDESAFSGTERAALKVLGLGTDVDRGTLRRRYSELVRRYHPDRNGGDRSHEAALQKVISAYQRLKGCAAFA